MFLVTLFVELHPAKKFPEMGPICISLNKVREDPLLYDLASDTTLKVHFFLVVACVKGGGRFSLETSYNSIFYPPFPQTCHIFFLENLSKVLSNF